MNDKIKRWPLSTRVSASMAEIYQKRTREGGYRLHPDEVYWRDLHPFFESVGYKFRPRYEANWEPSWLGTNVDPFFCEDSITTQEHHFIDARKIDAKTQDERLVGVKKVTNHANELEIARFLLSSGMLNDPRNHCVEILDIFNDPNDAEITFIVMPLLRPFNNPPFVFLEEAIDFVLQVLEGLCFMHENHIAHRDCADFNIMMDATNLYPQGFHPIRIDYTSNALYKATPLLRCQTSVKYFFIDFGMSTYFPGDTPPIVVGNKGRDRDVPELSLSEPYDAYKVDVHILGNAIKQEFLVKYEGAECLDLLVKAMTEPNPRQRASASIAFGIMESIKRTLPAGWKKHRLREVDENMPQRLVRSTVSAAWRLLG